MKFPHDSRLLLLGLALGLLVQPVQAAKMPAKAAAKTIRKAADPAAALIAQAHAAQAKGESELAVRLAQSAIVADPAQPATYDALGDVYAASGQADFARNYYNEALQIDPMDAAALKALATMDNAAPQRAAQAEKPAQQ